jgi:hypothetical protein
MLHKIWFHAKYNGQIMLFTCNSLLNLVWFFNYQKKIQFDSSTIGRINLLYQLPRAFLTKLSLSYKKTNLDSCQFHQISFLLKLLTRLSDPDK